MPTFSLAGTTCPAEYTNDSSSFTTPVPTLNQDGTWSWIEGDCPDAVESYQNGIVFLVDRFGMNPSNATRSSLVQKRVDLLNATVSQLSVDPAKTGIAAIDLGYTSATSPSVKFSYRDAPAHDNDDALVVSSDYQGAWTNSNLLAAAGAYRQHLTPGNILSANNLIVVSLIGGGTGSGDAAGGNTSNLSQGAASFKTSLLTTSHINVYTDPRLNFATPNLHNEEILERATIASPHPSAPYTGGVVDTTFDPDRGSTEPRMLLVADITNTTDFTPLATQLAGLINIYLA